MISHEEAQEAHGHVGYAITELEAQGDRNEQVIAALKRAREILAIVVSDTWPADAPQKGDRVRALGWVPHPAIDDNKTVPPGTEGTVTGIDAIGTIHVRWDNGAHLGLIEGDRWEHA